MKADRCHRHARVQVADRRIVVRVIAPSNAARWIRADLAWATRRAAAVTCAIYSSRLKISAVPSRKCAANCDVKATAGADPIRGRKRAIGRRMAIGPEMAIGRRMAASPASTFRDVLAFRMCP